MPRRRVIPLILAVLTLDRVSKLLLKNAQSPLIPGLVSLTGIRNTGAAFGIFAGSTLPLTILTALIVLLLGLYLWKEKPGGLFAAGLALITAGAAGNLTDRITLGYVIDFIELEFVRFAIFNVADIAITLGCALALAGVLFSREARHG